MAGLIKAKGRCVFQGQDWQNDEKSKFLPTHKRKIGYVFQNPTLFSHLNVKENIAYSLKYNNEKKDVNKISSSLGVEHLLERKVYHLSGGEKQRVAIAQALVSSPDLLLLDEPLSSLDEEAKEDILKYLNIIKSEFNIPIFLISHFMDEISGLADYGVFIEQGKVKKMGLINEVITSK